MIHIDLLLIILISHFIADFIFQTDEMAQNKSKSNYWLFRHIVSYTGWLLLSFSILYLYTNYISDIKLNLTFTIVALWAVINGLIHGAIDYYTSRWTSSLWERKKTHDFFVIIGLDQLLHAITLIVTAEILLR